MWRSPEPGLDPGAAHPPVLDEGFWGQSLKN